MHSGWHDIAVRSLSSNINYVTFTPRSWVLYGQGEGVIEFRDKVVSLAGAAVDSWMVVIMSGLSFLSAYGVYESGITIEYPFFRFVIGLPIFCGFLGIFFILLRWWTPSFVRISGGTMSVLQPHRWNQKLREFSLADVVDVETSAESPTFHSLFSIGVRLRDGRRICFLRCRDTPESKWTLNLMKAAMASRGELISVPALQISLPPPPLPAMADRVASIEEQVVRTAPPGRPDSQSGSISNQNRA